MNKQRAWATGAQQPDHEQSIHQSWSDLALQLTNLALESAYLDLADSEGGRGLGVMGHRLHLRREYRRVRLVLKQRNQADLQDLEQQLAWQTQLIMACAASVH